MVAREVDKVIVLVLLCPRVEMLRLVVDKTSFSNKTGFLMLIARVLFTNTTFLRLDMSFDHSVLALNLLGGSEVRGLISCMA